MARNARGPHAQPEDALAFRRIVAKVGTNLLTAGGEQIDLDTLSGIAAQVAALRARGAEVILVTSGAVQAGRQRLRGVAAKDVRSRQVLAAIGQSRLMSLWEQVLQAHNLVVAQALLTRHDLSDRLGYLNARNTLLGLLELGVVPVINENDVVAVEEIRGSTIGDNDNLSALVANLVDADLLLLLSDVAGLYTADPTSDPEARIIPLVDAITPEIEAAAGASGERGTGGMVTKLQAARVSTQSGTHVVIAHGLERDVLVRVATGEAVGTRFNARGSRLESRRRFLLSGLPVRGMIEVDEGAVRALATGRSLLPAGVVAVSGSFERGDVVQVLDATKRHVASGTANYAALDVTRIRGLRSDRINEVLGYDYGEEVVHRNNLVLV